MITPEIVTAVALWCDGSIVPRKETIECRHKFIQCVNDKQDAWVKEQKKIDIIYSKKNHLVVPGEKTYLTSKILILPPETFAQCFKKIED